MQCRRHGSSCCGCRDSSRQESENEIKPSEIPKELKEFDAGQPADTKKVDMEEKKKIESKEDKLLKTEPTPSTQRRKTPDVIVGSPIRRESRSPVPPPQEQPAEEELPPLSQNPLSPIPPVLMDAMLKTTADKVPDEMKKPREVQKTERDKPTVSAMMGTSPACVDTEGGIVETTRVRSLILAWLDLIRTCLAKDVIYFNQEEQILKVHLLYQLLPSEVARLLFMLNVAVDKETLKGRRCDSCFVDVLTETSNNVPKEETPQPSPKTTESLVAPVSSSRRSSISKMSSKLFKRGSKGSKDRLGASPMSGGEGVSGSGTFGDPQARDRDRDRDEQQPQPQEAKLLSDNVPFLTSLLPPSFAKRYSGEHVIRMIRSAFTEEELQQHIASLLKTQLAMEKNYEENFKYRWNMLTKVMTLFGAQTKFNFTMPLSELLAPTTLDLWRSIVNDPAYQFKGGAPEGQTDTIKFGTQGQQVTDHHEEAEHKGRLRRSISKMRTKIHYHKDAEGMTSSVMKVPKEAKDVLWTDEHKRGVTVSYRFTDQGIILARVTAKICCPLVSILAVLYDVKKYNTWVPYTYDTVIHKKFTKACFLVSIMNDMPWPIRKRETYAYCHGIDAFDELGCVVLYNSTPTDPFILGYPAPPPFPGIPRLPDSHTCFFLYPVSETKTVIQIYAKVDPGMSMRLLRGIIVWVVRSSCLDFLVKIATLASNYDRNKSNVEQNFYDWMDCRVSVFLAKRESQRQPQAEKTGGGNELEKWLRGLSTFRHEG